MAEKKNSGNKEYFSIENPDLEKNPPQFKENDAENNVINQDEGFVHFLCTNKKVPLKAILLSFFLMIAGLVLFILGFFSSKSYVFWIAAFLIEVPGVFFSVKACKAYSAKDVNQRNNLLNDIPDMWED